MRFSLTSTSCSKLWDFGWFDLSRFRAEGSRDPLALLEGYLASPLSRRSFCTADPWGVDRNHGPIQGAKLGAPLFEPLDFNRCLNRVEDILRDSQFTSPPTALQSKPIDGWLTAIRERGDALFALRVPLPTEVFLDHAFVWLVFQEFISISPEGDEVVVAVFGYD
jgi:hypothetical protein